MSKKLLNLIFIGPPGGGKGTEIQLLQKKKKYYKISTGDLLRNEVEKDTKLGKTIKKDMDSGTLIKDTIVSKLITQELTKHKQGLIFDGYPRNLKQAKKLDKLLADQKLKIDAVIHLDTPDDLIIKRITGRYICKKCGATYNKHGVQPKKAGICDVCKGIEFKIRSDDKVIVVKKRLADYHKEESELLGYYTKKEIVHKIDGSAGDQNVTHKQLLKVFKSLLTKQLLVK
jgi:adenylate kinase